MPTTETTVVPTTKPMRASATLVVVRNAPESGVEVLLLKRADRNDHNSNAWVFPGGVVDAGDRAAAHGANVANGGNGANGAKGANGDDANGDAAYAITAIRECFEECGLLYAADAQGRPLDAWTSAPWQAWCVSGPRPG